MEKKLKIGIVGCGAIGTSLAKAIRNDFKGQAEIVSLYDTRFEAAAAVSRLACGSNRLVSASLKQLVSKAGLVIESASANSSFIIAREALKKGRDIMIMSVGGVVKHKNELSLLARKSRAKVYIPSGAIAGIDALKAAAVHSIKKVILTTRKNPLSFKNVAYVKEKNIDLGSIKNDKLLFSGSAEEAVKLFPQNINVAAILSMAGIGSGLTRVRIVASPSAKRNIHEVKIVSDSAEVTAITENVLHPENPKTSFLAVLSAIAVLKQILDPIRIGT